MVGQIGCVIGFVALVIIGVAFGAGWYLDEWLGNERKIFTVLFMLGSFPVTLYAMVRLSLWMVARAQTNMERLNNEDRDKSSV